MFIASIMADLIVKPAHCIGCHNYFLYCRKTDIMPAGIGEI